MDFCEGRSYLLLDHCSGTLNEIAVVCHTPLTSCIDLFENLSVIKAKGGGGVFFLHILNFGAVQSLTGEPGEETGKGF